MSEFCHPTSEGITALSDELAAKQEMGEQRLSDEAIRRQAIR